MFSSSSSSSKKPDLSQYDDDDQKILILAKKVLDSLKNDPKQVVESYIAELVKLIVDLTQTERSDHEDDLEESSMKESKYE